MEVATDVFFHVVTYIREKLVIAKNAGLFGQQKVCHFTGKKTHE